MAWIKRILAVWILERSLPEKTERQARVAGARAQGPSWPGRSSEHGCRTASLAWPVVARQGLAVPLQQEEVGRASAASCSTTSLRFTLLWLHNRAGSAAMSPGRLE